MFALSLAVSDVLAGPGAETDQVGVAEPKGVNGPNGMASVIPDKLPATAQTIYNKLHDQVLLVEVKPIHESAAFATGTGFLVSRTGLALTNFHVVSEAVWKPDVYRLSFRLTDGSEGALTIQAVDVVHDLALVQLAEIKGEPVIFSSVPMRKGDVGYSLGHPLQQGITIIEGIFNDLSESFHVPHYHFTAPLNPGMSGGPAVNSAGEVFGINVAMSRRGQSVSFLVPASFGVALLERHNKTPLQSNKDFKKEVATQLHQYNLELERNLLDNLDPPMHFAGYQATSFKKKLFKCTASHEEKKLNRYSLENHFCYLNGDVFVGENQQAGSVDLKHLLLRNRGLNAMQFSSLQQNHYGPSLSTREKDLFTPYLCEESIVKLKGTRAKAAICSRRLRNHPELFDVEVHLATLDDSATALHSRLRLGGFNWDPAMRLVEGFMGSIAWQH
ncbi:MAG: trypsin-like peptidase domain-containing protein [Magnetococcales bacterium]|nr:trypsin-like peptidase domain-containing protein [Magnetococcales bacterium]